MPTPRSPRQPGPRGATTRGKTSRDLTPPGGPLGHLMATAAGKKLRLKVETPEGPTTLVPSDLVRIARDPVLLASAFGCPLTPLELARRLEVALIGALPGALLDLTGSLPGG